jgi:hypothetical protein
MLIVGQFYTFTFLVEKICSSLLWPLLQCLQFISHVKQHQCLIQWRQNSCNVSGPFSCLPHFGSHLSRRLELHVPLYEYWEVDLVVDQGCRKTMHMAISWHEKNQIDLHEAVHMFLGQTDSWHDFQVSKTRGCNPWILYLLKEPELVMLHCVIIAQLMLDFTIRKLKYPDINDNVHVLPGTWLVHLQWGPTWIDSTLSLCCDARGCYSIAWHSFAGSVVCVVMFDRMGSWLLLTSLLELAVLRPWCV